MQGWKLLSCSRHSSEPPTARGQQVPDTHLLLKQILSQLLLWALPKETLQPLNCLHTVSLSPRDLLPTARGALKAPSLHSHPSQHAEGCFLAAPTTEQTEEGESVCKISFGTAARQAVLPLRSHLGAGSSALLRLFLGRHGSHYNYFAACCNCRSFTTTSPCRTWNSISVQHAPTSQLDELGVRITK